MTTAFWAKVAKTDSCWNWIGAVGSNGYGAIRIAGRTRSAHRLGWEIAHGEIPSGMTVDHLCFNTLCVNPTHLEIVSRSENSRRQRSATKAACANGHLFTAENTYIRPSTRKGGVRQCRACNREAVRRYKERRAAA